MTLQLHRRALLVTTSIVLALGCGSDEGDDTPTTAATAPTSQGGTIGADDGDGGSTSAAATTAPATTAPADDGAAESTGPAATTVPEPGTTDAGGSTDDGTVPGTTTAADDLQHCLDMAADECEQCACNECLAELVECQADPGCVAIRMCAQANGCTGIACLGPCGDVINANGGPLGSSTMLASTLSDCYTGACPGCG